MAQPPDELTELEHTIQTLQQILEVMPENTSTLETLYGAYIKTGQLDQALATLARLESAARSTGDQTALAFVLEQYASIENEAPDLKKHADTLRSMSQTGNSRSPSPPPGPNAAAATFKTSVEPEMTLAWELLQDEHLTQDEYAGAISDLTELSSAKSTAPVTLLNALFDRNYSRMERLMAHLSVKTGMPVIEINRFEADESLNTLFSPAFCVAHALVPFAKIGNDILIGVLNPSNRDSVAAAEAECGQKVHPCLISVQEFDLRVGTIRKAQES